MNATGVVCAVGCFARGIAGTVRTRLSPARKSRLEGSIAAICSAGGQGDAGEAFDGLGFLRRGRAGVDPVDRGGQRGPGRQPRRDGSLAQVMERQHASPLNDPPRRHNLGVRRALEGPPFQKGRIPLSSGALFVAIKGLPLNYASLSHPHLRRPPGADVGANVRLSGWCHRKRDHGGLLFVDLRDHYGMTQCVVDPGFRASTCREVARRERRAHRRRGGATPRGHRQPDCDRRNRGLRARHEVLAPAASCRCRCSATPTTPRKSG